MKENQINKINKINKFEMVEFNSKLEIFDNKIVESYIKAFAGKPWYETWGVDDVKNILNQAKEKKGFYGVGVLNSENFEMIGFSFGYEVPQKNTQTVAFSQIYYELEKLNKKNSFYLAEVGVIPKYQGKSIGTSMMSKLKSNVENIILRTKNEHMIKAIENGTNKKLEELFYDPIEKERMWYGVN